MKIESDKDIAPVFRTLYDNAKIMIQSGALELNLSKYRKVRTNPQNRYYHKVCTEVAVFLNDNCPPYGEFKLPYDEELIHKINKKRFGLKTTKEMSVDEFCNYMQKVIAFWQEKTHYTWFPDEPVNIWRLHNA